MVFPLVLYGHYNGYFYFVNMGMIIERHSIRGELAQGSKLKAESNYAGKL
jgi:hypothetical protein